MCKRGGEEFIYCEHTSLDLIFLGVLVNYWHLTSTRKLGKISECISLVQLCLRGCCVKTIQLCRSMRLQTGIANFTSRRTSSKAYDQPSYIQLNPDLTNTDGNYKLVRQRRSSLYRGFVKQFPWEKVLIR